MSTTHDVPAKISVAFIGNPNTGKSTLFNALCGVHQRTGNYPGVTVEKKLGRFEVDRHEVLAIDLPGTYSLAARSPDEMIAVDVLLGRSTDVPIPDVILCLVDASNLERHLYLVSQVLELGRPVVLGLNMVDVAADKGIRIDVEQLSHRLGLPVVSLQAHRKQGIDALRQALLQASRQPGRVAISPFPEAFRDEVNGLLAAVNGDESSAVAAQRAKHVQPGSSSGRGGAAPIPRFLVERALLDVTGYLDSLPFLRDHPELRDARDAARRRLNESGYPVPAVEALARYQWVEQTLAGVITRTLSGGLTWQDRWDKVLTHRFVGTFVFLAIMVCLFQSVFWVAEPASQIIDGLNGRLAQFVESVVPAGDLQSLLVNGVIAGVGGVLVFLPQIFTLFFFIAVLEDCGYMARAAYLTDKLMSRLGLSGKSFIPLLSSFACAIPGIMAARVIENRRDRLITILVAPLMTCSARLPVYTLLIAAFVPAVHFVGGWVSLQGLVMLALYLLGIIAAIGVAFLLKRTLLPGTTPPFVMELPTYKWPSARTVLYRMLERGWAFVRRAGTMILAVTIVIWGASYYPRSGVELPAELLAQRDEVAELSRQLEAQGANIDSVQESLLSALETKRVAVEREIDAYYLENSYLGRLGRGVEPVVRPLGWDWRLGCAAIASFPAREVVIATLGVIYRAGEDADEETLTGVLRRATHGASDRPVFTLPVALSVMVFFALCAQCASTLAAIRRETNSWHWPLFTFVYMTTLAYLGALITYQVGSRL